MKLINLIVSALATIGSCYYLYEGNTVNALLLLILAKLYNNEKNNTI